MVLPILLYGSEVWGCSNISDIEVFYRKFLKIILKVGKSTPNCMVYGESGKLPLQLVIEKRLIFFWLKISEDKSTKIATQFYRIMLKLQNTGEYSFKWQNKIKSILTSVGFINLWDMQEQYETKYPISHRRKISSPAF